LPVRDTYNPKPLAQNIFLHLAHRIARQVCDKVTRFASLYLASLFASASRAGCSSIEAPGATPEPVKDKFPIVIERGAGATAQTRACCAAIVAGWLTVKTPLTAS
jgi:hypothetical protein